MTSGSIASNELLSVPQQLKPAASPRPPAYSDAISVSLVNGMVIVSLFGPSQAYPGAEVAETAVATVALTPGTAAALSNGLQQVIMAPLTASASEDAPN